MTGSRDHEHVALKMLSESGLDIGPWATPFVETAAQTVVHMVRHHDRQGVRTTLADALGGPTNVQVCNVCTYNDGFARRAAPWLLPIRELLGACAAHATATAVGRRAPGTISNDDLSNVWALFGRLYRGSIETPEQTLSGAYQSAIRAQQDAVSVDPATGPVFALVFDVLEAACAEYDAVRRAGHATRSMPSGPPTWLLIDVRTAEPRAVPDAKWAPWAALAEREPLAVGRHTVLVAAQTPRGRHTGVHPIAPVPASGSALSHALRLWEDGPHLSAEDFSSLVRAAEAAYAA